MVVVAGFTVEAGLWKSLVGAHAEMGIGEYFWEFTKTYPLIGMRGMMLDIGRRYALNFRLFPVDYRCDVESLWVRGVVDELVKVSKRFRKGDQVRVEVRDKELWVGAFKVGDVIPYELVGEIFPEPKPRRDFALELVVEDFRRMVKKAGAEKAYEWVGFRVKDREATIMFFDEKVSRVDVRGYEPWCFSIEGEGESAYSLELFSKLLHLGFATTMELSFESKGILTVHYRGDDIDVRFWLAQFQGAVEGMMEILAKPTPRREQLWVMHEEEVKKFEGAVKAVSDVNPVEEVHMAMTDDLWVYWDAGGNFKGYLKASRRYFWEFRPPPARFSAVFNISHLARFLADVEELTCFVEGEPPEALVLVGKGAKITPKELRSWELKMGVIDVPRVEGFPIFSGRGGTLESVLADAEDAGDLFLVFVSTWSEIIAFGRDAVYYRASLPIDAMKHIEDNYVPIREGHFRVLRNFFGRFPDTLVTMGKSHPLRFDIYLALDLDYWIELRAMRGQVAEEVDAAIKAYKEEFEKPPPPPPKYVKVRFLTSVPSIVGADLKVYGPFRTGMVMDLPEPNAEAMVKQGLASYEFVLTEYEKEMERVKKEIEEALAQEKLAYFLKTHRTWRYLTYENKKDLLRGIVDSYFWKDEQFYDFYEKYPELLVEIAPTFSLYGLALPPPPKPPPEVPIPAKITKEEFAKVFEDLLDEWLPFNVELLKPGLEGEIHYIAPGRERELVARFTSETIRETNREEIEKRKEETYGAYEKAYAHKPEIGKIYLEALRDSQRRFARDIADKTFRMLVEEAKKIPPPPPPVPPPKPEIQVIAEEAIKELEAL